MKKIPDITEQALKKALGELERSIRDTKRESRATDERVAAMDSQRAQLADEVASAHDRCDLTHCKIARPALLCALACTCASSSTSWVLVFCTMPRRAADATCCAPQTLTGNKVICIQLPRHRILALPILFVMCMLLLCHEMLTDGCVQGG